MPSPMHIQMRALGFRFNGSLPGALAITLTKPVKAGEEILVRATKQVCLVHFTVEL